MGDVLGNGCGIKHMAEVHSKDRQNDEPGGHMMAEQFHAHELARAGINRDTHQQSFWNCQTILNRDGAKEQAKGGC